MPFGLWARTDPRNHELDQVQIPWEGAISGKWLPIVKYRDFLLWAVRKRLKRSICHMGCGLGWAEGSTSSIIFARWRQCTRRHSAVSCTKMAELIDLPFGLWTLVGWRKHKFNRIRHVATKFLHGKADWRHLANTIEPPICGGDAVLCQTTLTQVTLIRAGRGKGRCSAFPLESVGGARNDCG